MWDGFGIILNLLNFLITLFDIKMLSIQSVISIAYFLLTLICPSISICLCKSCFISWILRFNLMTIFHPHALSLSSYLELPNFIFINYVQYLTKQLSMWFLVRFKPKSTKRNTSLLNVLEYFLKFLLYTFYFNFYLFFFIEVVFAFLLSLFEIFLKII